jgi:hypothetical protein
VNHPGPVPLVVPQSLFLEETNDQGKPFGPMRPSPSVTASEEMAVLQTVDFVRVLQPEMLLLQPSPKMIGSTESARCIVRRL